MVGPPRSVHHGAVVYDRGVVRQERTAAAAAAAAACHRHRHGHVVVSTRLLMSVILRRVQISVI